MNETKLPEIIYVYHEYADDLAYGEQLIRVFRDHCAGQAFLKERVEKAFSSDWETISANAGSDDTVEPDYVSVKSGEDCQFFILEEQPIL